MLESSAADSNETEPNVNPAKVVNDLFWLSEQCELRCIFEHALWYIFVYKIYFIILI